MPFDIAFYVHHHGSGHLMRCLAIAKALLKQGAAVTLIGSKLESNRSRIPESIQVLDLPMDVREHADANLASANDTCYGLHYAPLCVSGQRERTRLLTDFFAQHPNLLLVVDVSVEIAMLARLAGVPTVIVRQHGDRTDLAHQLAYQNALALIAPYGENLKGKLQDAFAHKTIYTGGFSKFTPQSEVKEAKLNRIGILVGNGGTSLNFEFMEHLSKQCPEFEFQVLGDIDHGSTAEMNRVHFHGKVADPLGLLQSCAVIIGNTGHNTVMEVATLQKHFITIPEERPFQEQEYKARILQENGLATVVKLSDFYSTDWNALITAKTQNGRVAAWGETIDAQGVENAATAIVKVYTDYFKSH